MEVIRQDLNIEGLMELDRELQIKKGNEFGYAYMVKRFGGKVKWMTASPARTGSVRP